MDFLMCDVSNLNSRLTGIVCCIFGTLQQVFLNFLNMNQISCTYGFWRFNLSYISRFFLPKLLSKWNVVSKLFFTPLKFNKVFSIHVIHLDEAVLYLIIFCLPMEVHILFHIWWYTTKLPPSKPLEWFNPEYGFRLFYKRADKMSRNILTNHIIHSNWFISSFDVFVRSLP